MNNTISVSRYKSVCLIFFFLGKLVGEEDAEDYKTILGKFLKGTEEIMSGIV